MNATRILSVALCGALVAPACTTVPETGRSQLTLFPESEMAQLGDAAYEEATAQYPTVASGPEARMVERVGQRIAEASGHDLDWEFRLLDAPDVVNAFALPGGKVAVYSGLLSVTQNEDALAAVVGHEVAHATARHGNERMSQTALAAAGTSLAAWGLDETGSLDPENRDLILGALGVGAQVGVLLPYSRKHESEADEIGLRYLIRAGYDPYEAPALWERMAALSDGQRPPEILSTHPDPRSRAERLRELIPRFLEEEGARP